MDLRLRGLRREVMAPRRPSSSFGLVAVSTLAMVFAVSSSLLLFSAHRHRPHRRIPPPTYHLHNAPRPPLARQPRPDVPIAAPAVRDHRDAAEVTPAAVAPAPPDCRGPIYRSTADGHTEAVYELCTQDRPFAGPVVAD